MERTELLAYLDFAQEHKCILKFTNVSGKVSKIRVNGYDDRKLIGRFASNNSEMSFGFKNIQNCRFLTDEDQALFEEEQRYFAARATDVSNIKKRIALYKQYYQAVICQAKKDPDNLESEPESEDNFVKMTLERYDNIFNHIYSESDGLLLHYLLCQPVNNSCEAEPDTDPILLLSRSNYSQKQAIEAALRDRVSMIEGPPGTGKTTTILSIIANLLVRGKRVAVVSKNNSAIDNIKEELDALTLPPFYLRLGNSKIMQTLEETIKETVSKTLEQAAQISDVSFEEPELTNLYSRMKEMEADINRLVIMRNRQQEDENQLRHLVKRQEAFRESPEFPGIHRFQRKGLETLRKEIDRIARSLHRLDESGAYSLWDRLLNRLRWKMSQERFQADGLLLQFKLEHLYLNREIKQLTSELERAGLQKKQKELADLYTGQYIKSSLRALQKFLLSYCSDEEYQAAASTILSCNQEGRVCHECRDELRSVYPVILTTADALVYNCKDLLENGSKIDYIIIDEASQCDLLAGIPVLYLANRCVVVGDQKQLSAITGNPFGKLPVVDEPYDYYHETFLSSVRKVWNLQPTLLREHYRCDYSIINYCNKFYYDGDLIIYTDAHEEAIRLLKVDQGKYAAISQSGTSFYNEREIKAIEGLTGPQLQNTYVITPFSGQGNQLKSYFHCEKDICGTIHAFQGRGQDTVYFSTVFNDLRFADAHLAGDHCLFSKELVNVAVSRAKKQFVLVSDAAYLRKKNEEMRNLIDYIETYGKEIPDKTVCLFDGLYQRMKAYTSTDQLHNVFEQTVYNHLTEYCRNHSQVHFLLKLPLADLVTDQAYLDEYPEIRRFVLHRNTHLDFTLYNAVNNPILVIELDGEHHRKPDQMERDAKKDAALAHMGIPLWRLPSKAALTAEEFVRKIDGLTGIGILGAALA